MILQFATVIDTVLKLDILHHKLHSFKTTLS